MLARLLALLVVIVLASVGVRAESEGAIGVLCEPRALHFQGQRCVTHAFDRLRHDQVAVPQVPQHALGAPARPLFQEATGAPATFAWLHARTDSPVRVCARARGQSYRERPCFGIAANRQRCQAAANVSSKKQRAQELTCRVRCDVPRAV